MLRVKIKSGKFFNCSFTSEFYAIWLIVTEDEMMGDF